MLLDVSTVHIWQHRCHNDVFHVVLMFWLTLGRIFALFLNAFVDFEYSLFSENVIKCYLIFVEHQIGVMFMGVVAKP